MSFTSSTKNWFTSGKFLYNKKLAALLWFGLAFIAVVQDILNHKLNNYIIFKHVYIHSIQHVNLYLEYPHLYEDVNLYGPVFGLIIAPFALLPDWLGVILWVMFNTAMLFLAIRSLPIKEKYQTAIILLCSHEMMNAASWLQSNPLIAACIIFSFSFINKGKDIWGLFFIMLATFIKLYGIVGLAFFFFSKDKIAFVKWAIIWFAVLLVAPAVLSSLSFVVQCYHDWFNALVHKEAKNVNAFDTNDFQDICVMGMIRRVFNIPDFKNIYITIPAVILFALQYLQFRFFSDLRFRLYLLCTVLIMTVIFTTSAESPTYIIAFPAMCLWYVLQVPTKKNNALFIFALLLTSFSYSDIFTPWLREHVVRPYSLKALPGLVLWCVLIYQVYTKQFLQLKKDKLKMQTA
ncbi:MAG: DUF2029 domain-containing protein [Bacteroidota bacterium]|nr:DUF2029 domain-containing protein [Bacteroidota bacterium]